MITTETLTIFLGWCTVINISVLLLSTILLVALKESVLKIHNRLFGLDEETLSLAYFQYLGNYKIAIYILNLVPYIALKIMT